MAIRQALLHRHAPSAQHSRAVARRPVAPVRGKPVRTAPRAHAAGLHAAAALAPRAVPVHLGPAMTMREAFAAIALNCSAHVMVSARFTERSADPDGVHELRVAIRRMRAALSIFRAAAASRRRFAIGNGLRTLQRKLAAAREWDVLIDDTIGRMPKSLRKARAVRALAGTAERRRAAAYRQAHALLRAPESRDLLRRLHAWIDSEFIYGSQRWRNRRWRPDVLSAPVAACAAAILTACHAKVRKRAEHIRDLDAAALHRLRIRVKKLRYSVEFFASLWPGRPLRRYLAALKDLQQGLGAWHDAVVAGAQIARLAPDGRGPAIAPTARRLARRERALRKDIVVLWGRFAKRKRFWENT